MRQAAQPRRTPSVLSLKTRDHADLPATPERALTVESPTPVRILTVCTGNICRSPVAERLLQAGLDQVLPGGFQVRSAGTHAMVGDPIQPPSAEIVRTYGGTAQGFAARQLTAKILRETDIVLTMTSKHRGEVLQLDASLLKRTFTIREFARMVEALEERDAAGNQNDKASDAGTLWRGLPARLASVRHLALAADSADNEVIDPYRRDPEVYRQMEDELAPAILTILRYARLNTPK
jgi:protein-tyrosine phosphatase